MKSNILIIGGLHGNETLGLELVKMLKKNPIEGINAIIGNPRAVKVASRFIESDLNRSFGKEFLGTYETKRAEWLKKQTESYDVVLDFHNTQTPRNNCCFVGFGSDKMLYDISMQLGMSECIQADYDCINKFCPNVLSIEISKDDLLDSPERWYEKLKTFSLGKNKVSRLNVYTFLRRVTWDEKNNYKLSNWQPFKPIAELDKQRLDVSGIIVPIFVGSRLTEYWATLLTKKETL